MNHRVMYNGDCCFQGIFLKRWVTSRDAFRNLPKLHSVDGGNERALVFLLKCCMKIAIMVDEIEKRCFIVAVAHGFLALIPQLDWYLLLSLELDANFFFKSKDKTILIREGSNAGEELTSY